MQLQMIANNHKHFLCRGIFFLFFCWCPFHSFFMAFDFFFFMAICECLFYCLIFLKNSFWLLFFNGFFNMLYIHRRTRDPAGNNGSMTMSLDWTSLASSYWKSMFDLIKNQNHISFSNGIKRVVEFAQRRWHFTLMR